MTVFSFSLTCTNNTLPSAFLCPIENEVGHGALKHGGTLPWPCLSIIAKSVIAMSVIALCLHPSFYLLVRSGQQEDWPCPCPFRYVPHVRLDLYCMTAGLNVRLELYTFIG